MNHDLSFLLSSAIVFVGAHIMLSHPLRSLTTRFVGEKGFMAVYSLIALVSFGLMIHAFGQSPRTGMIWDGWTAGPWIATSLLTIVAMALLIGSFVRNPALPHPGAQQTAQSREATGVFAVTRHPMMWAFAVWAVSHIIVSPNGRTIIFAGSLLFLALVGAALQDLKKRASMGEDWEAWQSRTRFWPDVSALARLDWKLWAGAVVAWFAITWVHLWFAYIPAGIWRWLV